MATIIVTRHPGALAWLPHHQAIPGLVLPGNGPPITLKWKGKVYKTNHNADWLFTGHAEPGDFDAEGIPYFEEVA